MIGIVIFWLPYIISLHIWLSEGYYLLITNNNTKKKYIAPGIIV